MISYYNRVLEELRKKTDILASGYIPQLYDILRDEDRLSPEQCRTKIESDCSDIWSKDTIRKYLPPEAKNATKRKAGTISAEVKRKKKSKLLAATTTSSGQYSAVLDSDDNNYNHNSVGMNPTENASIGQKEQESSTFQKITDSQHSGNVWTDDNYFSLVGNRLKDEALELLEESSIGEYVRESVLLTSELAEEIYLAVNASRPSEIIPEFELEHNGIQIVSVRMSRGKLQKNHVKAKADSLSWRIEE